MTRYQPLWQQSGTYQAQMDRQVLGALWPNGGSSGAPCSAVNNTMNINIPPGSCAVPLSGAQGSALCVWDAAEVVTMAAAHATLNRQDLVICQVRDNAIDSGGNNDFIFTSVTGTPAAPGSAVPPAVPANAYAMVQVAVAAGIANLNSAALYQRTAELIPGASALYWRNAAFQVSANPGIGGWLDTMDHDDFGNIYGTPTFRNDDLVMIPAAGKWRVEYQVTATPAANGWVQAQLKTPKGTAGAPIAWANSATPTANWSGARCVAQGRYPQGYTMEPIMSANVGGMNGVTGIGTTFLLVTYLGP